MASEDRPPLKSLGSVLVVGGCGFLGSHIVRQLLDSYSCDISVLDLRTTTNRYPNVSYHEGNITSLDSLRPIFSAVKPTVIIHTASPAFTSGNAKLHQGKARSLFHSVNVTGTSNLLACASETPSVQAFIYTSSSSVIHDTVSPLCNANESYPVLTSPFQPEYYAETKALAESLVLAHNRHPSSPHLLTASIRPAGIFGEGDLQLIAGMMKALAKRQTAFQLGPNTNLFDFTYVGNAAHAHILAAIALLTTARKFGATRTVPLDHERADGQAFFVTNAQPVYFWDFARAVWATAGDPVSRSCPAGIWTINETLGLAIAGLLEWIMWVFTAGTKQPSMTRGVVKYSCMTRYFDTGKAKSVLGYTPVWGLDEGVERTVRWWKEKEQGKVEQGLGEKAMENDEGEMRSEGEKVAAVVVET